MMKGREMLKKSVCISLLLSVLACAVAPCMPVHAASSYVDTSGYTELDDLYKDYFRIGVAVQAIDHWNDPTAEIGNPDKENGNILMGTMAPFYQSVNKGLLDPLGEVLGDL